MTQSGEPIQSDVAIIGGGLVGAALALALARQGLASVVCDPVPLERSLGAEFDGRAYAIALASRRFLDHLGVWERLAPDAQPINDIVVSDSRPGERASSLCLHFDAGELGPDGFGHMIEDHLLRRAVLEAARAEPEVTLLDGVGAELDSRDDLGAELRLSDGRALRAPLVVGCDGRRSALAAAVGIERYDRPYDQVGLVCAVGHEKPHAGVAHELFLPSGPFAILPLTGDRCSLVWTERADMAEAFRDVSDAVYLAEVSRRFGDFLGPLHLIGERWAYPLSMSMARRFVADRAALVGDAARGVHPVAGQGLNYGFRDAAALAETLGAALRRGEDWGALHVLERYERWRRPDSWAMALATDGLNRLFSNDVGPLRWARRLGLAGFGRVGPLRRAAMRYAAGDREDLPTAMRG